MECVQCNKVLSKRGSHFMCQGPCQGTYHRHCVKGLAADMKAGRNRIHCNNCEEDDSDIDDVDETEQVFNKILKDIQSKVSSIPSFKKQLDSIRQCMSMLSDKYDSLIAEHTKSKERINALEKSVTTINNKCIYLEKHNIALEQKVLEFEQSTRKQNIEIVGLEQLPDESTLNVVTKLGDLLQVNAADIEWARRIHAKKQSDDKPASIIVGFKTSGAGSRDAWLSQRRKVADVTSNMVTGGNKLNKIYINEDLPKPTKALLWTAKKKLHGVYRFVWISNGRVLVKKNEGDKTLWVRSENDVNDLLNVK